jgi:hypothetical protein
MEHKTLDEIRDVADILPVLPGARPLSKGERLKRWAEALERESGRRLTTLFEMEYALPGERAVLRASHSMIRDRVPKDSPAIPWAMPSPSSASVSARCTTSCASAIMARQWEPMLWPYASALPRRTTRCIRGRCSLAAW